MPREVGQSSAPRTRSTTPARSRAAQGEVSGTGTVRVWSEASVTVNVGDFNSIKFAHGFERLVKNDKRSVVAAEREIFEACEVVVNRRLKQLAKLLREMD